MPSTEPAKQPQNLPLITCIALCGMAPLAGLSVSGIAPLMPQISAEFANTPNADVLVRLMMSGLSAATIIGALGTGVMAARVGTTRLLLLLHWPAVIRAPPLCRCRCWMLLPSRW